MMTTVNDWRSRVRIARMREKRTERPGVDRPARMNVAPAGELAPRSAKAPTLHRNPPCGEGLGQPLDPECRSRRSRSVGALVGALIIVGAIIPPGLVSAATHTNASSQDLASSKPAVRNLTTTDRIKQLEASTRANPKDGEGWRNLGAAYVRRAFETADPAFYPLAESALKQAQKHLGSSPDMLGTKAVLALARHRFQDARSLAGELVRQRPGSLDGRIALFDAEVELGNYQRAFALIDELVFERPNVATLSRLSYRRQLTGDLAGSEVAMRQAVSAAPSGSIDRAIALAYLGDVLLESGRLAAAARTYEQSLRIEPTNGTAMLGSARVAIARRDADRAAVILDRLVERVPLPGALGLRADLARASGDQKMATTSDQLVDASVALFEANGAVVDSELAILLADRGSASAPAALRAAERAYRERRTIFTNDAMAWALFVSGRPSEAVPYARAAVAKQPGVSSVRWHAAEVFAATGDLAAARHEVDAALRNPWSSPLQTRSVVTLAKRLGVAVPAVALSPLLPTPATTPPPRSTS